MTDLQLPLDYAAIERILPHRYPFLLVDRIIEFEPDHRIVGIKNISHNETVAVEVAWTAAGATPHAPDRGGRTGRRHPDPLEGREPEQTDLLHGDRSRALPLPRASGRCGPD